MALARLLLLLALAGGASADPMGPLDPALIGAPVLPDEAGLPRRAVGEPARNILFDSVPRRMALSVLRVDAVADGAMTSCTGFAVEGGVMTAAACLPLDMTEAVALSGETAIPLNSTSVRRVGGAALVAALAPLPPALPLADRVPGDGEAMVLIGRPRGGAVRIAVRGCAAGAPALSDGRLVHLCGGAPGLAGAPLIDIARGEVVGVHVSGTDAPGFALPAARIARAIAGEALPPPDDAALLADLCAALGEAALSRRTCAALDAFAARCPTTARRAEAETLRAVCREMPALRPAPAYAAFDMREGTDLPGGDLGDTAASGVSLPACEAACGAEPACLAYTYRGGVCRLKSILTEPVAAPGTLAGIRRSEDAP